MARQRYCRQSPDNRTTLLVSADPIAKPVAHTRAESRVVDLRKRMRERDGLSAGGRWIRTPGSPTDPPEGKLIYAGRAGTGLPEAELERLWHRLHQLAIEKMPLAELPPRGTRFGSPLVLTRIHWVRPEMVVEVSYAEWTPDGLLRHVVYLGQRQDKLAAKVRRRRPHAGEP